MTLDTLESYKILSFKTKTALLHYGQAQEVIDEGNIFRIHDLQVISKYGLKKVTKDNNWFMIKYKS